MRMKKRFVVCLEKLPLFVCVVCMLLGYGASCANLGTGTKSGGSGGFNFSGVEDFFGDFFGEIGDAATGAINSGKIVKQMREFDTQRNTNPLNGQVEDRLTRRTSTLSEGTPVDVSPYLLHKYSIAVTEKGIKYSGSEVRNSGAGKNFYEIDVVLTFMANEKNRQMNITVLTHVFELNERIKQTMKQYAAERFGVRPEDIQNFQAKLLDRRKGNSDNKFELENVFIQDSEPCYYQFDVEVEYQKDLVKRGKKQPENFAVFNKVYHSNMMSAAGAAIDTQFAIWEDARKNGFAQTPLPIINIVKSVKVSETAAARADRIAKEREEQLSGDSSIAKLPEERLTRRTSALTDGIPIDISPYLANENSFAVFENGIQHNKAEFKFSRNKKPLKLCEYDIVITFTADGKDYQMNKTVITNLDNATVKSWMQYLIYDKASQEFRIEPKSIKKLSIKFLKEREKSTYYSLTDIIFHDIEPCYYQFDVEVEYHKTVKDKGNKSVDTIEVYNRIYRSNFTTITGAVLDLHEMIRDDIRGNLKGDIKEPVINVVKAVKYPL